MEQRCVKYIIQWYSQQTCTRHHINHFYAVRTIWQSRCYVVASPAPNPPHLTPPCSRKDNWLIQIAHFKKIILGTSFGCGIVSFSLQVALDVQYRDKMEGFMSRSINWSTSPVILGCILLVRSGVHPINHLEILEFFPPPPLTHSQLSKGPIHGRGLVNEGGGEAMGTTNLCLAWGEGRGLGRPALSNQDL